VEWGRVRERAAHGEEWGLARQLQLVSVGEVGEGMHMGGGAQYGSVRFGWRGPV
jgi:hypothetical protein